MPRKKSLTDRQGAVMDAICKFFVENQKHASIRELGGMLGISVNAVAGHLKSLEDKGYIRRSKGKSRSIFVIGWKLKKVCRWRKT